jgi:hypothetical protein
MPITGRQGTAMPDGKMELAPADRIRSIKACPTDE